VEKWEEIDDFIEHSGIPKILTIENKNIAK
jgi:hypothetical protein